jgi:uncharacterized RDD family membrane protein YckC
MNTDPSYSGSHRQFEISHKEDIAQHTNESLIRYAGFGIRLLAMLIDLVILMIVYMVTAAAIISAYPASESFFLSDDPKTDLISSLAVTFFSATYGTFMIWKYGATLGKMAVGIRVISDDDKPLSIGRIVLREFAGKQISQMLLCIGFLYVLISKKKQGYHDLIAETVVAYK